MSLLATVQSTFLEHDGLGTVRSMAAWCGAYGVLHQGLYYASRLCFPRSAYPALDEAQPKYWNATLRRISTARVVALTHAVASWGWSIRVLSGAWASLKLGAGPALLAYGLPNDAAGLAFMRHSLGYFIQELAHVLYHEPDPIFIAHHLLYLFAVFPLSVVSDSGWAMVALATVFAEATNPLQLSWEMSKAYNNDSLYHKLSAPFTAAFALCRGVLMPLAMVDIFRYVTHHPKPILTYTYVLMTFGIVAGLAWLALLIKGFVKYRRKRRLDPKAA